MASFSPGTGRRTGVPAGPSSVPAPSPGTLLFARYRLEAYLGSTAAAEVWRADDERLDRVVALRLIHVLKFFDGSKWVTFETRQ